MGPHNEVNAVLGRSFAIMSKTAGGLHAGKTTFSGLEAPSSITACASQKMRKPSGRMGSRPRADGLQTNRQRPLGIDGLELCLQRRRSAERLSASVPDPRLYESTEWNGSFRNHGPEVAAILKDSQGFKTKRDLATWLADNVEKPSLPIGAMALFPRLGVYGHSGPGALCHSKKAPPESMMKPFQARGIGVIVTGQGQTTWFATDFGVNRGVLIDEWK